MKRERLLTIVGPSPSDDTELHLDHTCESPTELHIGMVSAMYDGCLSLFLSTDQARELGKELIDRADKIEAAAVAVVSPDEG